MKVEARGKINLTLNVFGRREDGYHDLELIFQPISLSDILTVEKKAEPGLEFTCTVKELENEDNLVYRMYERLLERYPGIGGLRVHLEKRIPYGSGLGGGSADVAALIRAVNQMFGLQLGRKEMMELGAGLGADVPACMLSRAAVGTGIGDQLSLIDTEMEYPLLLLQPKELFSTASMYQKLDESGNLSQERLTDQVKRGLETGNLSEICDNLYNVFEEVVPDRDRLQELKALLVEYGASASLMTGSGSCVYGIFKDAAMRDQAYEDLKKEYQVYSCEAVNR
ncbi:4-(cytidine 5'-diphospho)-2-C-methyl-D-erythritol kinase [Hominifimenecus sp. rT4P-3]|uniref:4-(cytidine 5'-diphospho)-2-C-methyl-D-erythritol kinase n=1 Tax=Hominifimenecus sp. rT4P-3 TaxID=3242979 RepID=UPI003DA29625